MPSPLLSHWKNQNQVALEEPKPKPLLFYYDGRGLLQEEERGSKVVEGDEEVGEGDREVWEVYEKVEADCGFEETKDEDVYGHTG